MRKFDLGNQLEASYGQHRSGWSYAISVLKDLHDPNAMYLDTFIERTYVWGQAPNYHPKAYIPEKDWCGFIHVPPYVPEWFPQEVTNENIFKLSTWEKSYKFCKGLFTLSKYHKTFLEKILDVPIDVVYHPMDDPDIKWDPDAFIANPNKSIIQVGWWCRNLHAIFELPKSGYRKIFLKPRDDSWFNEIMEREKKERIRLGKFRESMYESAEIIKFLPNEQYDDLLSKNIVFIYLYDASANNTVVECISRNTPLLVNKIPPVVEYLGEDYPFYYSSYEEAIDKAHDIDLLIRTYDYLKNLPIKHKLTLEYFRDSIVNSRIFSSDEFLLPQKRNIYYYSKDSEVDTIYVVTPVLNNVDTIDETIQSVISQSGPFKIRYHIQDGGSSDGTLEKLEEWQWRLKKGFIPIYCQEIKFTFSSEPDNGIYDAIVKGFSKLDISKWTDIMTWINADDILMPGAFALAYFLFKNIEPAWLSWVVGIPYNFANHYPFTVNAEYSAPREIVAEGCADGIHWFDLQQEGSFFRKWLWDKVDANSVLPNFKNAGDWNLWRLMAQHATPTLVPFPLGAFRNRMGSLQLSQTHKDLRQQEIDSTIPFKQRRERFKKLVEIGGLKHRVVKFDPFEERVSIIEKSSMVQGATYYFSIFKHNPGEHFDWKEEIYKAKEETILHSIKVPKNSYRLHSFNRKNIAKFFIVTPSLNSLATLDETILSVVTQEGDFYIYYHIQDGCSTDMTIERLQYWEYILSKPNPYVRCLGVKFSWASEPDRGIYDAIIKGFNQFIMAPNDWLTWINADDVLMPGALKTVLEIARKNPDIHWIGTPQYVFEKDLQEPVLYRKTPTPTSVIREGLCDGQNFPMLQQEGTFFKYWLWFRCKHILRNYKYAGDYALWKEMAKYAEYYQHDQPLGAFRRRSGQMSVVGHAYYLREMKITK